MNSSTATTAVTENDRGMSLVEILMVMVIIGIMLAVAVPNVDFGRYRVETAMQSMGSTLLSAQRTAITGQHDVVVYLVEDDNMLRVHRDLNNNGQMDALEIVRNYPLGDNVEFGKGGAPGIAGWPSGNVTFTKQRLGNPYVTFHRNGSSSEFGGFYLTSRRSAASGGVDYSSRAVQIDRATGRTSWFRYTAGGWVRGF